MERPWQVLFGALYMAMMAVLHQSHGRVLKACDTACELLSGPQGHHKQPVDSKPDVPLLSKPWGSKSNSWTTSGTFVNVCGQEGEVQS